MSRLLHGDLVRTGAVSSTYGTLIAPLDNVKTGPLGKYAAADTWEDITIDLGSDQDMSVVALLGYLAANGNGNEDEVTVTLTNNAATQVYSDTFDVYSGSLSDTFVNNAIFYLGDTYTARYIELSFANDWITRIGRIWASEYTYLSLVDRQYSWRILDDTAVSSSNGGQMYAQRRNTKRVVAFGANRVLVDGSNKLPTGEWTPLEDLQAIAAANGRSREVILDAYVTTVTSSKQFINQVYGFLQGEFTLNQIDNEGLHVFTNSIVEQR